jgi:hypothetical protein
VVRTCVTPFTLVQPLLRLAPGADLDACGVGSPAQHSRRGRGAASRTLSLAPSYGRCGSCTQARPVRPCAARGRASGGCRRATRSCPSPGSSGNGARAPRAFAREEGTVHVHAVRPGALLKPAAQRYPPASAPGGSHVRGSSGARAGLLSACGPAPRPPPYRGGRPARVTAVQRPAAGAQARGARRAGAPKEPRSPKTCLCPSPRPTAGGTHRCTSSAGMPRAKSMRHAPWTPAPRLARRPARQR